MNGIDLRVFKKDFILEHNYKMTLLKTKLHLQMFTTSILQ